MKLMHYKSQNGSIVMVAVVIGLIGIVGGLFYYFKTHPQATVLQTISQKIPSNTNTDQPLLSGKMTKLDQDLGLFVQTEDEKLNNITAKVTYYDAGKYTTGQYTNYKRIAAIREATNPSGPTVLLFATKDDQTYIVDTSIYAASFVDQTYIDSMLNHAKVTAAAPLPSEALQVIKLDDTFSLLQNNILHDSVPTGQKDQYGNDTLTEVIVTNFSSFIPVIPAVQPLTFYTEPYKLPTYASSMPQSDKQLMDLEAKYLLGTTQVDAVDSSGLGYSYDLVLTSRMNDYLKEREQKLQAFDAYNKLNAQYQKTTKALDAQHADQATYPKAPEYPDTYTYKTTPYLLFTRNDITSNASLFNSYFVAFPTNGCGIGSNSDIVKNISDTDLTKIGTSGAIDFFVLTNNNHPLYQLEYGIKMQAYGTAATSAENPDMPKPTFEAYVAKHPLLFTKDHWGKWIALGEYDYKIPGGCGKPVVYLYPTQPTQVHVAFTSPMQFDVSIPTYKDGWDVLANPNGQLTDLQPEATNCSVIDTTRPGSEYASKACLTNNYPYLYWAGQSLGRPYPTINTGWIIARDNLTNFMDQTLDTVGFTANEKNDMLSYWLPQMLAKQAPYYRISFLQTDQMNALAPMAITPSPASVYRLFLDYQPLASKPDVLIEPEVLGKVNRKGFTVVEWGGLNR